MRMPPIVSPQEWMAARDELLVEEKKLTHARDALAARRRRMPRMAVEREYRFEGPNGPATLGDLFEGRWQLILYRFFSRSSRVPRSPTSSAGRPGWGWELIPWYTITDDFDKDFDVDEWHGTNVFFRDGDEIFRTYFVDGRGDEALGGVWSYLDITALGRQEDWEDSPDGYPQGPANDWIRRHDEYDASHTAEAAP